jgi:hypothetical protein
MATSKASLLQDEAALQSWFEGRIPIVIGTVGHRDFRSLNGAIAKAVRRECRRLRKIYRHSPFLVLSGLAEGADRLVADIAMEMLGAKLIAILPFPAAEFTKDFATNESRREFETLMSRAAAVFEMPVQPGQAWKSNGEARDAQYARVGALIAEQSQLLIALWDGRPARGLGGTGDVVEWFERGYAPPEFSIYKGDLSLFDPPQPGLCIRIDTTTAEREYRNAPPRGRTFGLTDRVSIYDILRRTDSFNRDVDRQVARRVKRWPLVPPEILIRAPVMEAYAAYGEADALAGFYQARTRRADSVLYTLALTAVFALSLINDKPLASWSFLAAMILIAVVVSYKLGQALDTKSQEYRTFAEAMRILYFWRMLGLREQVWLSYLSKHGSVVRWLRHAIRAIEFVQDRRPLPVRGVSDKTQIDLAIDHWVGSQIVYFKQAIIRHSERHRHLVRIIWITVVATFATSLLLAVMTFGYSNGWQAWDSNALVPFLFGPIPLEDFIEHLQLILTIWTALAIVARAYLSRTADLEVSKQYAAIREKFDVAERAIAGVPKGDPDRQFPEIFERLGREALLEHAEWLWLRHSRPFEMPN